LDEDAETGWMLVNWAKLDGVQSWLASVMLEDEDRMMLDVALANIHRIYDNSVSDAREMGA